jgi:hypothetical protein
VTRATAGKVGIDNAGFEKYRELEGMDESESADAALRPPSTRHPPFLDRQDAGRQLANLLLSYKVELPVVLALPRGGVPVA